MKRILKIFQAASGPRKRSYTIMVIGCTLILMAFVLTACQTDTPEPTDVPPTDVPEATDVPPTDMPPPTDVPPEPTDVPPPDQSAYWDAVSANAMNTYSIEHGPNTWCTRCHSPQNWDPAAFRGPPPSCFTCKFPHEEEMRVAEGNPFVSEDEWVGIMCETCHEMTDGFVTGEIAWLNPITMEYVDVNTPTELCEKCHVTTTDNSFGSAVDHLITLGGSAHLNYGGFLGEVAPPEYCTDCHDPHTLQPSMCVECHTIDEDAHAKGSYALMGDTVTCMACHDASGLDVGPHPDEAMGGIWVTQVTEVSRGTATTSYVLSHSIKWAVACDKCHYEENPWDLVVLTAAGEIPDPPDDD